MKYEDSIMPEIAPCDCCSALVDEGENYAGPQHRDGAFICVDCADEGRIAA